MRQSPARFSGPESSPQIRSLADFIGTTSEFKFSVHTTIHLTDQAYDWHEQFLPFLHGPPFSTAVL